MEYNVVWFLTMTEPSAGQTTDVGLINLGEFLGLGGIKRLKTLTHIEIFISFRIKSLGLLCSSVFPFPVGGATSSALTTIPKA